MTVFIDTAVIMYAAGRPHPLRTPCREILDAITDQRVEGVVSSEVVQEILHRFTHIGDRETGTRMAEAALDIFTPVIPITETIMRRTVELVHQTPRLSARDLVHVATCQVSGIDAIVSPDRGFDGIIGLSRIDPARHPFG